MRESKIDPKTGKTLFKVQPEGLPAIWVEDGYCVRCETYGRCLGLQSIEEEDWEELKLKLNTCELDEKFVKEVKEEFSVDLSPLLSKEIVRCHD